MNRPDWKKVGLDEVREELSALEKYILRTQNMVYVRGKSDTKVPIILPPDCRPVMNALVSYRKEVGITDSNPYLFTSTGSNKFIITQIKTTATGILIFIYH
jgi:hypothetical protein